MSGYKKLNMDMVVKAIEPEALDSSVEEIVWNGVSRIANSMGITHGDDHFLLLYHGIKNEYDFIKQHHCYMQYLSLQLVRQLLETGDIGLVLPKGSTDLDIQHMIENLASHVVTALSWTYASALFTWVDDEHWEQLAVKNTVVPFELTVPAEMHITEEGDHDH